MKTLKYALVLILLTFLILGCGQENPLDEIQLDEEPLDEEPFDPVFSGDNVVGSPLGSIPNGAVAISPNGNFYLVEMAPYGHGVVVVVERYTDEVIQRIDFFGDNCWRNPIKGLAWDIDSRRFAVMYHGGCKPGITIFELYVLEEIGRATHTLYDHWMAFDPEDENSMLGSQYGKNPVKVPINYY